MASAPLCRTHFASSTRPSAEGDRRTSPLCTDSLIHAETKTARDDAGHWCTDPVEEAAACLAAYRDRILESLGSDKGDTSSLALQKGVGPDGRAMANRRNRACSRDLNSRIEHSLSGIRWCGKEFDDA